MDRLAIADTHIHLWDLERDKYPWLQSGKPLGPFGERSDLARTYRLEHYVADAARQNVTGIVHIEAGWDPADPVGETRWVQEVADRYGAPHAIIGHANLAEADAAATIEAHARFPLFRGIRCRLQQGDFLRGQTSRAVIDNPRWRRGLRLVQERGLSFDLQAPPALMGAAATLADAHPGLQFVLTHAGYPPPPADQAFPRWQAGIRGLAARPNVAVKLSGFVLSERAWIPAHAGAAAQEVIARFGPARVMVASNFPVDRLFAGLDDLFDSYREWLSGWPEADQRRMLSGNAERIYRFGRSTPER
jgi:predicted TIM-barrel fold metal-dependent hydrolase